MKKNIANAILSVAVVTAMMFSATACGAKNDDARSVTADAPAATQRTADANAVNTAETKDADVAETRDTKETKDADKNKDDTSDKTMTLEEWTKTDVCAGILKEMKEDVTVGQDVEVFFEVEGDEISMVFRYGLQSPKGAGEEIAQLFKNKTYTAVFEQIHDYFIEVTGNQDVVFEIVYRNADNSEIFSKKFPSDAMTIEEWTKTAEIWTAFMDKMNGELEGVSYSYEVDGDMIILTAQYDKRHGNIADLNGEKREAYDEYMEAVADGIANLAEMVCDEIIDETGNENVGLRIEFRDVNNALLYSQDF